MRIGKGNIDNKPSQGGSFWGTPLQSLKRGWASLWSYLGWEGGSLEKRELKHAIQALRKGNGVQELVLLGERVDVLKNRFFYLRDKEQQALLPVVQEAVGLIHGMQNSQDQAVKRVGVLVLYALQDLESMILKKEISQCSWNGRLVEAHTAALAKQNTQDLFSLIRSLGDAKEEHQEIKRIYKFTKLQAAIPLFLQKQDSKEEERSLCKHLWRKKVLPEIFRELIPDKDQARLKHAIAWMTGKQSLQAGDGEVIARELSVLCRVITSVGPEKQEQMIEQKVLWEELIRDLREEMVKGDLSGEELFEVSYQLARLDFRLEKEERHESELGAREIAFKTTIKAGKEISSTILTQAEQMIEQHPMRALFQLQIVADCIKDLPKETASRIENILRCFPITSNTKNYAERILTEISFSQLEQEEKAVEQALSLEDEQAFCAKVEELLNMSSPNDVVDAVFQDRRRLSILGFMSERWQLLPQNSQRALTLLSTLEKQLPDPRIATMLKEQIMQCQEAVSRVLVSEVLPSPPQERIPTQDLIIRVNVFLKILRECPQEKRNEKVLEQWDHLLQTRVPFLHKELNKLRKNV